MGLQISLSAITDNWRSLAALAPDARPGAVVKADAYGLGAAQIAPALYAAGARDFFVALAGEGRAIRPLLGDDARIFVLSGPLPGNDLTGLIPVLNSAEQFFRDRVTRPKGAFAIQLDTGMNRLGMERAEWAAVRSEALSAVTEAGEGPALVMSHLANADEPEHPSNAAQLAEFRAMTEGVSAPRSLAATGGILLGADYHFDLIRPGIGLYGGLPFAEARAAVRLSLPVIQTRTVAAGESVGYGFHWTAERPSRVATVAAGYADGILRALSGKALRLWAGERACPVIGRVSMDLLTVDVTDLPDIPKSLTLLDERQGVDAVAELAGTIGYEILTSLGPRYPREWV
ncbi:alanine racemase [Paracoccus sp. Z118]|uniref:alanine racemase n=1 Tax=Paracoccus sp. Z118 TaxID=2851017 RepID=UPI001C2BE25E|nr:alanine racemase [Paracoccus sp. Z118]MBV0892332.1 alanine racemase [Paracoccus sp. Z118]